ncbi:hypothetical protein PIPA1_37070 [Pelosinus sp. IPA-1]|nr:hypothetical protein PIPA1_37070 [Pelosinus sp. IPA-1]
MTYCDDTECQYYNPNGCTASEIYHSTDRFCVTGRRAGKSYTQELMKQINCNCKGTNKGYKSKRSGVLK